MDLAKQQSSETITSLLRTQRKSQVVSLVLMILALVLFFAAVNLGDAKITPQQIARIVWGKMTLQPHWFADIPAGLVSIVWEHPPAAHSGGAVGWKRAFGLGGGVPIAADESIV